MAKKMRRVKGPRLSETQLRRPDPLTVPEVPAVRQVLDVERVQEPASADFGQEYHYVVKDLERIGILAAAMLGGLVVLSLIL